MKISVIIPAYNAEKTIAKCLDSIVAQEYKDLEVIVINDGSTDNTDSICSKYSRKYDFIKYFNNDNYGVSYSRNFGVDVSTGDYITFVDSDDYLESNCYSLIADTLKKNDVDFLRYNFKCVGGKGFSNSLYGLDNRVLLKNDIMELRKHFLTSLEPIPNLVMLLVIRSDLAKTISFNDKLVMMEDVDYYSQLFSKANSAFFLDKKKYNYYINPNSVTHSPKNTRRLVMGIVDTNFVILNNKDYDFNVFILKKINSNHLRIISNIFIENSLSYVELKKIIFDLIELDNFKNMLKNYDDNDLKFYNKFVINSLKNFNYFSYINLKFIKLLKKLKK